MKNSLIEGVCVPVSQFDFESVGTFTKEEKEPLRISTSEHTGVNISWKHVNAVCPDGKRRILKNITGECSSGSLMAIMGSSGSGKTTFLNYLTRNIIDLKCTGDIRINGIDIGHRISKISGYVRQDDIFLGELTVLEHLRFRAKMTCKNLSDVDREAKIMAVMDQLGLSRSANMQIGTPGVKKTLSGGERKRLSLAQELMTDPKLLFCDEPTSGLDFATARRVIKSLQHLSSSGMTVICTIHQPSSEIFATFSHIMLLSNGILPFLGTVKQSVAFFESIGRPVPMYYNPADHFLEVLDGARRFSDAQIGLKDAIYSEKSLDWIVQKFEENRPESLSPRLKIIDEIDLMIQANWSTQVNSLIWRQFHRMMRDPLAVKAKFLECITIAIFYGIMFYRTPNFITHPDTFKYNWEQVTDINGACLMSLIFLSVLFIVMVSLRFMTTWPLIQREISDSVYTFSAFYIAESLVTQIFATVLPICYGLITYALFGLKLEWLPLLYYCSVLVMCASLCLSVGYLVSSFSPNVDFTIALLPAGIVPLIVFCGYIVNVDYLPYYIQPFRYISWYSHLNELLQINQWSDLTVEDLCTERPEKPLIEYNYTHPIFGVQPVLLRDDEICRLRFPKGGESILADMGFAADHWQMNCLVLMAETIVLRVIAYCIYKFRLRKLNKNGII